MNKLFKNGDYVLLEDCRAYDEKHGLVDGTTMWNVARKMKCGEPYRGYMVNRNCDKCVGITPAFGGGYVGLWTTYNMTNQLTVEEVLTRGEVPTKQELFEKALNDFDVWPYDEAGMIYCTGGTTNYKAGEFSSFHEDTDSDLNTSFWKFVCTREEFETAKAKRKIAKDILNITTDEQALTMLRAYLGRIQKHQIKVTVENATNEKQESIYTKEMHKAGERPEVGMMVEVGKDRGEIVSPQDERGNFVVIIKGYYYLTSMMGIKPIDTRTAKEKAIDELMEEFYSEAPFDDINILASLAYDKFSGDNNENS